MPAEQRSTRVNTDAQAARFVPAKLDTQTISQIADFLKAGPYRIRATIDGVEKMTTMREWGKQRARGIITSLYPDVDLDYLDAWIDGGKDEHWYGRTVANLMRIADLEAYEPGCTRVLTEQFGIRNFNRFSVEHWIRQYEERDMYDTDHLPIFMSNDDHSDRHLESADKIEYFERRNRGQVSVRIYEWATDTELTAELERSASTYGPAERNLFVISHGNWMGIRGGLDSLHGYISFDDLPRGTVPWAMQQATAPYASIVLVCCQIGQLLDPRVADPDDRASFAERLANLSDRSTIASHEEIRLRRLIVEEDSPFAGIIPIFRVVANGTETLGSQFFPSATRRDAE